MIRTRRTPIGVDLCGRWMKAAQLTVGSGGPRFHGACRVERRSSESQPDTDEIGDLLEAAARSGCEGSRVVVGVPPTITIGAALSLPPRSSGAPLEQIAKLELARTARVPPETIETAMWDVPAPGRGGEATHVVAIGLPHAESNRLMSAFDAAGYEVERIDARGCALGRAAGVDGAGASLLIDVGWDHTGLLLLLGGRVLYQRVLTDTSLASLYARAGVRDAPSRAVLDSAILHPDGQQVGGRALDPARAALTAMLDTVATEAERSLAYAAHRYPTIPIGAVRITGDGGGLPGLASRLACCELPVQPLTPVNLVRFDRSGLRFASSHGMSCAMGLALPGLASGKEAA
ncbi:MAG: hypothetical protein ACOYN0_00610 [Phycisphaerales bacterium]